MENIVSVDGLNIDLPDRRLFENLAFDIPSGALTCITGENGVGKTSLLDALEYLLLGGNDYSFNSAANKKSSRSVKSYIRGKIGSEENSNLREGDILSHIAIEIVNDKTLKTSVLGVVFELTSLNNLKETFYRVKNAPLIEGAYSLDSGKILNFDELKEVYEEHDFRERLQAAINKLPPQKSQICKLKLNFGLSNQEIADKMHIALATVKSHYTQAIKILRQEFIELCVLLIMVVNQ